MKQTLVENYSLLSSVVCNKFVALCNKEKIHRNEETPTLKSLSHTHLYTESID